MYIYILYSVHVIFITYIFFSKSLTAKPSRPAATGSSAVVRVLSLVVEPKRPARHHLLYLGCVS